MPIRAVFIDFGNVFSTYSDQQLIKNLAAHSHLSEEHISTILRGDGDNLGIWHAFESGDIEMTTLRKKVTTQLCAQKGLPDIPSFIRAWTDIFIRVNTDLEDILSRIRAKGIPLYLISNCDEIHYEHYFLKHPFLLPYIPQNKHILSFRERVRKPDSRIYEIALAKASCKAEDAVFIDDKHENIKGWERHGGHGILYHAGSDPIRKLRLALKKHKVIY